MPNLTASASDFAHDLRVRLVGTDDAPRVGALSRPARLLCRPLITALFQARVIGIERVPTRGPVILAPNHLSFFDTPLVMATSPRPVIFLGKAEYMNHNATKFLFPALGMVPIKRDVAKASMAALTTAAELLDAGRIVGIYPEGTRTRDGLLHRGHTGVAQLALMTGAPIVPVGLIGTDRVQPIGTNTPRPFSGPISIEFGNPIYPTDYQYGASRKRRQQITDDVMAAIAAITAQPRSPDFATDRDPLIRGGSESVYLVNRIKADGLSWAHAAERAVDEGHRTYDDSRVGEIRKLRCRVTPDGELSFETELAVSTRLRSNDNADHPTRPRIRVASTILERTRRASRKGEPHHDE